MKQRIKSFFAALWTGIQEWAERKHLQRLEEGCEYCLGKPVCPDCYRCYDKGCNGGCIFCRKVN